MIGASGLLGQHLATEARARGLDVRGTYATTAEKGLTYLNLGDLATTVDSIRRLRPKTVLLAAAMTSVDGCEARPDEAERINAEAPHEIGKACASLRARLVFFSTDYVFDGRTGPSDEDKPPNPLGAYGRTKARGERNVLEANPSALILRSCANFGWNRLGPRENSVTWILNRLRKGDDVPLFTDQRISPSYVPDVARTAFDLLEREASGIFHVATRSCLTRLEAGEAVGEVFGLPKDRLRGIRMEDAKLRAPRPGHSCLAIGKLERFLHIEGQTFRDALAHMRDAE